MVTVEEGKSQILFVVFRMLPELVCEKSRWTRSQKVLLEFSGKTIVVHRNHYSRMTDGREADV